MSESAAIKQYIDFHQYEPKSIGSFSRSFHIPTEATFVGPASFVLYRSSKKDPVTMRKPARPIDYIHKHEKGVKLYRTDRAADGPVRRVPKWIHEARALTLLGKCLGFAYFVGDFEVEAQGRRPLPELYAVPSGKALLVVEGKRKVVALIWGGSLRVEPRGIVG